MSMGRHRNDNRANWNDRVPIRAGPGAYGTEEFTSDPDLLTDVVAFDKAYLGDVAGLTLIHPQCHIGTDTLSWAKLGARVTGVDFSPAALEAADGLSRELGIDARFVESELYAIPSAITEEFDIVYTGVGAITWLPDIDSWAQVMAGLTKPGRAVRRRSSRLDWQSSSSRNTDSLSGRGFP